MTVLPAAGDRPHAALTDRWEHRLRSAVRILALVLVVSVLALMAVLAVYLAGDDLYLANGTSRWASRADDPEARAVAWIAVGLVAVSVATLLASARSSRLGLAMAGTATAVLAVLAETATFVQYTAS